jgi:CheY-like chemotaxis protein
VRELMVRFLSRQGFRVETASSGREGLERVRQLRPDLITLDVLMPDLDGWSVLMALKGEAELAEIPVVMLTIVDEHNLGYALGAAEYLTKPIDRERLVAVLRKYRCAHPPCSILVVEDHEPTRALLGRLLQREGWEARQARNGQEALAQLEQRRPELILLDLMMPEMDGFQVVEVLRQSQEWRHIPVVVLTAKDLTEEDRKRLNGGVEAILQKRAYTRQELLEEVRAQVLARLTRQVRGTSRGSGP